MADEIEQKFGKPWDKMDDGEYKMAVQATLFDIRKQVKVTNGAVKENTRCREKHQVYFKAIWWIFGIVFTAIITGYITGLF